MLEHMAISQPQVMYHVLNMRIWWNPQIQGIGFGFLRNTPTQLDRNGFSHVEQLWGFESNQPLTTTEIADKFNLDNREHRVIDTMVNSIPAHWKTILQQQNIQAPIGNWVGCFETNRQDAHMVVIFQSNRDVRPIIDECSCVFT